MDEDFLKEKYDEIVFVSDDNKKAFNDLYSNNTNKELMEKEKVIYNYIDKKRIFEKSEKLLEAKEEIDKNQISIVTVARLVEQKAIDRLAKVHKKLIEEGLKHNIYVIGDGPQKEKLQNLIKELNIQSSFKLLGKRENPYPYIKMADYFALLTYFEGYPMAVEEAKILNKKIIITNTAAKEVIKDYDKKIILENNEEAIYEGLSKILKDGMEVKEENKEYDNSYILKKIMEIL